MSSAAWVLTMLSTVSQKDKGIWRWYTDVRNLDAVWQLK